MNVEIALTNGVRVRCGNLYSNTVVATKNIRQ